MKKRIYKILMGILLIAFSCGLLIGGYWLWGKIRPQPKDSTKTLFEGITYTREVRSSPRPIVIHVIKVDLRAKSIGILVTPGDPKANQPLKAQTTGAFLDKTNVQVAINGDSFTPWYSHTILDYYPHSGDPVSPIGFAASRGTIYSQGSGEEPTLYISPTNQARFNTQIGKIFNAISGNIMLVKAGEVLSGLESDPAPRSAVALSKSERELILVVVDGRQPGYSEGVTLQELAGIIIHYGGYHAMNLDGGGSSTLVMEGILGRPIVLNSPINNSIPGRQRAVANHLGIYTHMVGSE
jgi:hypothetical protein